MLYVGLVHDPPRQKNSILDSLQVGGAVIIGTPEYPPGLKDAWPGEKSLPQALRVGADFGRRHMEEI